MSDPLIEQLVTDLKPTKPMLNSKLWRKYITFLFLFTFLVLGVLGLRPDMSEAIQNTAMFWKPAIFFLMWLGAVFLITDIARPTGQWQKWHFIPVFMGAALMLWQIFMQSSNIFSDQAREVLGHHGALVCLSTISLGGVLAMFLTWRVWLSKTASNSPALLGALWGFSAASMAAACYSLHCNHDQILYIAAYYCSPIIVFSIIGHFLGKKLLKW